MDRKRTDSRLKKVSVRQDKETPKEREEEGQAYDEK